MEKFTLISPKYNNFGNYMNEMNGYEMQTTFNNDFGIADAFGTNAVKDTYKRVFDEWQDDVIYFTELALVLNFRCWCYYYDEDSGMSRLYSNLYHQANEFACEHFKDDDLEYYLRMTD